MDPRHHHISELIKEQSYPSAELAAKEHVQKFPLDGQGWLLLGESLMKQGKRKNGPTPIQSSLVS